MCKYNATIRSIAFFSCLFALFLGCDQKSETPTGPKVITKKIIARKNVALPPKAKAPEAQKPAVKKPMPAPKAETMAATAAKPKAITIVKPMPKPMAATQVKQPQKPKVSMEATPMPKPEVAAAPKKAPTPTEKTSSTAAMAKPAGQEQKMPEKKMVASLAPLVESTLIPKAAPDYDPVGKLDPFAPLFEEKKTVPIVQPKAAKAKRRTPLTPLEKVDLSQLELVAVILAPSGNKGMVKEASGKGYVVKEGTHIGNRSGKIVKILTDRIIVEEQVEDIYGKVSVKKRSLQIQKPLGE